MGFWFWAQVAVAVFTTVATIKAKRDFKKQQKKLNKNQGFEINRFGQDEPLYCVLGTRRVGPTFVYRGTKDTDDFDDIPNERYAALLVWSIGEVTDFKNVEWNDQSEGDWKTQYIWDWDGTYLLTGDAGGRYSAYYYANTSGAQDNQTDARILAGRDNNTFLSTFRNPPISNSMPWAEFTAMVDDDMTGVKFEGMTFSTLRIFLNEDNRKLYAGGEPKLTAEISGPKIRQPLLSETYEYSENPIDQVYWYLLDSTIGKGLDETEVDRVSFKAMADYCDELISTPDGDKPRFTSNYIIDTSQEHKEIIDDILFGCHATLIDDNGVVKVDIDRPKSPVMHFDDVDLVERINSSIKTINDRFNEVVVRFPDKDLSYKESEVSFPDRSSQLYTDWLAEDKGKQLIEEIELDSVTDYYEALRFAEYTAFKSRNSLSVTCSVGAVGLQLEEGDVITLSSGARGWVEKPFIIEGITLKANMVGLELSEYNAEVYSFVAPSLRVPPATPNLKNPFSIQPVTALTIEQRNNSVTATWVYPGDVFYKHFRVSLVNGSGSVVYENTTRSLSYDFLNLSVGSYTLKVYAVNNTSQSTATEIVFTVSVPATPTGLTVTDAYIEWTHPNLADIREFIIETTENTENDVVAYSQPPSSNGTQRLEISGIKAGDYDVSVTAKGLNNLLSLPATLTNAQIDGITPIVTPIVNNVVSGFTDDPHTWSALNNFTGGLQKNGVEVLARGDNGLGGWAQQLTNGGNLEVELDTISQSGLYMGYNMVGAPLPTTWFFFDVKIHNALYTTVKAYTFTYANVLEYGKSKVNGTWATSWRRTANLQESQTFTGNNTFTGDNNFTGQLLKNGSPVIGLEDLSYNSDESLAIAATTIEQFYKDQEAGLYNDFDQGVGSLAAGFVNSIINQANFLIANNANIDKLKSSAIEVSGSGYALNQNPTWQDTLDGWDFQVGCVTQIDPPSSTVRVANQVLRIDTTNPSGNFFSNSVPVSIANTYTVSVWVYQNGIANQYLLVDFYDAAGVRITGSGGGASGWGLGTYHYFGLINQPSTQGQWKKYEVKFGANGDATIPVGAASCKIGMLANQNGDWANTTVYLQDYRIEKANGRTHIENGAIQTKHLVLDGDGAITFDTIGAFPAASAGSLAYLDSIGSTEITSGAVTTPKIATQAVEAQHLKLSGTGSITFDTVGADQAGSAASAESAAKEYASKIAPIEVNAGEGLSWGFETGVDSFTAVNTSITHSTGRLVLTTTSTDPQIIRESLNYNGSENYLVSVRVKSVGQSITTAPILYYRTGGTGAHGWSDSYRDTISNITLPADEWVYYQFDMRNQSHGGTDYIDNNITAIRIDFATQSGVTFEIDSVQIGSTGGASRNPADNSIDSTKITSDAVTAPKIAANAITADKIEANALNGKVITGSTVQTASDTSRRVIVKDDGTYLLWAGSGSKNDTNAIFYIKANGEGFVKGEFFQGEILETASKNGSFTSGSPWSITATNHSSAGKSVKIDIAASFVATFTGNKTTENYTLICTVKRGTTTVGTRTFYNAPAFYNSISGTTEISITGQSFVTDSSTATGNRSYSLEVSLGGGGGTYNNVDVDLSIYTLENKLES